MGPKGSYKYVIYPSVLYNTSTLGTYTVQVRRKISPNVGGGEVESNKIAFNVVYNPVVERLKEQNPNWNPETPFPCPADPTPTPTPAKNR